MDRCPSQFVGWCLDPASLGDARSHGHPDRGRPRTRRPAKSDRPLPPGNAGVCCDCAENRGYVLIGAVQLCTAPVPTRGTADGVLLMGPDLRSSVRNRRCGQPPTARRGIFHSEEVWQAISSLGGDSSAERRLRVTLGAMARPLRIEYPRRSTPSPPAATSGEPSFKAFIIDGACRLLQPNATW